MNLRPDTVRLLEQEKQKCKNAIACLQERCRCLEEQYGWPTNEFLQKFNEGEFGGKPEFLVWYASVESMRDWQTNRTHIEEMLTGFEAVGG